MLDEGYIKYECRWQKTPPIAAALITELNGYRNRLYDLGLIGVYENGIGFGNISLRLPASVGHFVISGSATGGISQADQRHYAIVTDYDIEANWVACEGSVKASSESLTHASCYELDAAFQAVIHVHHLSLWEALLTKVPCSRADVPYGTPEMAREIQRLYVEDKLESSRIMAMAGHQEGLISFGKSLDEAMEVLMFHYEKELV